MLAQAECEKALEAWIDLFVGENDDEKGGGKYIRGNAGVFTNVLAALNRRRLPNHKTEAERAVEPDPPPPPRPKRTPPAKRPAPPTPVPTPGPRRSRRTPAKPAKENKPVPPPPLPPKPVPPPTGPIAPPIVRTLPAAAVSTSPLGPSKEARAASPEKVVPLAPATAVLPPTGVPLTASVTSATPTESAPAATASARTSDPEPNPMASLLNQPQLVQQFQQWQQMQQMQQMHHMHHMQHMQCMPLAMHPSMMMGMPPPWAAAAQFAHHQPNTEHARMEEARARLNLEDVERQALLNARLRYEMSLKR